MPCPHCASTTIREWPARTQLGYRTFTCRTYRRSFNERTGTAFNHLTFPSDIVLQVVLWRLRYKLSLRDLAEIFLARGFVFTHEAVREWEACFALLLPSSCVRSATAKLEGRGMWMRPTSMSMASGATSTAPSIERATSSTRC